MRDRVGAGRRVFCAERQCELARRDHILATFSAAVSRSESNRSAYVSSVIAALACPSIRCTTFGLAPAWIARLAAVWRSACAVIRGNDGSVAWQRATA